MCFVIIFQLQEAYSLEIESKENWNLKQSLKGREPSVFSRTIYIKNQEYSAHVAYHDNQVSPHDICYQGLPEKEIETI